jgi:hypothetical protein
MTSHTFVARVRLATNATSSAARLKKPKKSASKSVVKDQKS